MVIKRVSSPFFCHSKGAATLPVTFPTPMAILYQLSSRLSMAIVIFSESHSFLSYSVVILTDVPSASRAAMPDSPTTRRPCWRSRAAVMPPALRQNAGKGAVIHGPGAAGGAALLEDGGLGPGEPGQLRHSLRPPAIGLRHVPAVPGDHPVPESPPEAGAWAVPENLPAHGDRMVLCTGARARGWAFLCPSYRQGTPAGTR